MREYQTEVIVVPALLVGFFVILLTVILWLHCRGLRTRTKQEESSSSGQQGKHHHFQTEERVLIAVALSQQLELLGNRISGNPGWYSSI